MQKNNQNNKAYSVLGIIKRNLIYMDVTTFVFYGSPS